VILLVFFVYGLTDAALRRAHFTRRHLGADPVKRGAQREVEMFARVFIAEILEVIDVAMSLALCRPKCTPRPPRFFRAPPRLAHTPGLPARTTYRRRRRERFPDRNWPPPEYISLYRCLP